MTNSNIVHKPFSFLFFIIVVILLILSSGCVAPEKHSFYVYEIIIGTEGDAQNITLILPVPYYNGDVYSEIITDPSQIRGGTNISYDIIDTKYGKMLRVQSPKNGSIKFFRDANHSPINTTPWKTGEDPVLHPRFNQTPGTVSEEPREEGYRKPREEGYRTVIYSSFDGGANVSLEITVRLSGHTTFASHLGYSDRVNRETILHNASGEWIWVNGSSYN